MRRSIPLEIGQSDFVCLSKYLTLYMNLIAFIRAAAEGEVEEDTRSADGGPSNTLKTISHCIPSFILRNQDETLTALLVRVNSPGLTHSEIENILTAISYENRVHVRRPGKKRLFCKSYLARSPSEEEELSKPNLTAAADAVVSADQNKVLRNKRQK